MTVASQIKNCYASIKQAEATLEILKEKTQSMESKQAYEDASQTLNVIKNDLKQQIIWIGQEEPQYKS